MENDSEEKIVAYENGRVIYEVNINICLFDCLIWVANFPIIICFTSKLILITKTSVVGCDININILLQPQCYNISNMMKFSNWNKIFKSKWITIYKCALANPWFSERSCYRLEHNKRNEVILKLIYPARVIQFMYNISSSWAIKIP